MMQATDIEGGSAQRRNLTKLIRKHPVISFFVIAFAFTWTYDLVFLVAFPLPDVPGRSTPRDFGPSVAALVVTGVVAGKPGIKALLKRLLIFRVHVVWYLFAALAIPAVFILGLI